MTKFKKDQGISLLMTELSMKACLDLVRVGPRIDDIVSGFRIVMGLTWRRQIWSGLDPARVSETGCFSV